MLIVIRIKVDLLLHHLLLLATFAHFFELFLFSFFALLCIAFLAVLHHELLLLLLELLDILLRELSHEYALLPNSHRRDTISLRSEHSCSMLSSFVPLTSIYAAVGPLEGALTVFHIIEEVTFVLTTVRPCKLTVPMHLVLLPGTKVLATV